MVFNSLIYAIFLPIVFIIYWLLRNQLKLQNLFVVISSYVFYGWWDWRFLILIAITSFCSWGSGLLIGKSRESRAESSKFWLWLNIAINLGILAVFKYYDFFVSEFGRLFGIPTDSLLLRIILPVGISFYTFQALSYSIDVYRGNIKPTKDIIAFFAFISFFPQLVAGPIERATNLLPQFLQKRTFDYEQGVDGMRQILWGQFKKIVIADNCAIYVNQVWETYDTQSGSTLLLAAVLFTFQIYGDFSGYSDIAIGTAKLFGIKLMRNFNNPYFSRDIAEFWRRWHISLNTWFVDYVYIPLGGSRPNVVYSVWCTVESKKRLITIRNTFVIFLLSGLWHGANWTFLAWGAFHAALFLPLILLGKNRKYTNNDVTWRDIPKMLLTFGVVVIGWILFRAETIGQAWEILCGICNRSLLTAPYLINRTYYMPLFLCLGVMLLIEWENRSKAHSLELSGIHSHAVKYAIYFGLILLILLFTPATPSPFIYFQF